MMGVVERFWSKVAKTPTCWLWGGATRAGGYGHFWNGGKLVQAPRLTGGARRLHRVHRSLSPAGR